MQFCKGMACCNPHREKVGLFCDLGHQFACANNEVQRLAAHAPDSVARFLATLLPVFPDTPDWILVAAKRAGHLDDYIDRSARYCAALATKTERQTFTGIIAGHLSADQLDRFKELMAAEWRRLRSK